MANREPESCYKACRWMATNYGKGCLAPLTGTDWRAFKALVHAWELWTYTRDDHALEACVNLVRCMQPSTRNLGIALVPFAADWSDERTVRRHLYFHGMDGVSTLPSEVR